jgi:flavorubredoxin
MRVVEVSKNIYQFSTFFEPVNFTFNQYLIAGSQSMLVQTGPISVTRGLIEELKKALQGSVLDYLFISHFESDECGGLSLLLKHFPQLKPVCSQTTSRQLAGFGICDSSIVQLPGGVLETKEASFRFIAYNSEMHLWEGLVLFERKRGILFSSDLFMQFGKPASDIVASPWKSQLATLSESSALLPTVQLQTLVEVLKTLPVKLIAPGHGPCIRV